MWNQQIVTRVGREHCQELSSIRYQQGKRGEIKFFSEELHYLTESFP